MTILTNAEFRNLTEMSEKSSSRLKLVARRRYEAEPNGQLTSKDLKTLASIFQGSPDAKWLQSLQYMHTSGKIAGVVAGKNKWEVHVAEVAKLQRHGDIAFKLGDHVFMKESGKYGIVVDYFTDNNQYLVITDPYSINFFDKKDLEKTACLKNESFR